MRRVATALAAAGICAVFAGVLSCGGKGPTQPTPGGDNGGSNQQPPPNNLPMIDGITLQGTRPKEPANFSDVNEAIDVTAKVHDDETAVDQLQYEWTAPVGTFTGTGAKVTWTAPATLPGSAPSDVTITLKVIEKYGQPGGPQSFQHDVSSTATLSLHDSTKEVGDMAKQFLLDFSDSTIRDVSYIMRNFEPGCYGTGPETDQVSDNRKKFRIIKYTVGDPVVTVKFGSIGPYNLQSGDAFAAVPVFWDSVFSDNSPAPAVTGIDWVAAVYYPDRRIWRLCDSQFQGHLAASMRAFIR